MRRSVFARIRWAILRPWLGVAGLLGVGALPCPDCGAPMIAHLWLPAVLLALRNILRQRNIRQEQTLIQAKNSPPPLPPAE